VLGQRPVGCACKWEIRELKGGEGLREEETAGTCAKSMSFRVPAWALTKRVTYC